MTASQTIRIRDVPPAERPRERLARCGVESLGARELVALVLRSGGPGVSALDLADRLVSDFGGLAGLARARPEEVASRPGVGPAGAAALAAAFRLGGLAGRGEEEPPTALRSSADVAAVAAGEIAAGRRERVLVLVCDGANRLRRVEAVAEGTLDRSPLPLREILNAVLRHDGRAFAIAHNHPSGDPSPSEQDRIASAALEAAAGAVGLRFLDHVVVADRGWRSAWAA